MNPKLVFIIILVLAMAWSANKNPAPQNAFLSAPYQPPTETFNAGYDFQSGYGDGGGGNETVVGNSSLAKNIYLSAYGWSANPSTEYLTFTLDSYYKGKVLITGFEIKSAATGKGTLIGKGVDLPFAGQINYESPIFIDPGDTVVLVTGRSPIGYSFKVNKCTGYFEQFQDFTPRLREECPTPLNHELAQKFGYFNDSCLDYLQTIPSCNMPLNDIPLYLQSECRSFVNEKLNYKSCVEEHKNDQDFYKKEWRIYLGRSEELWKERREVIKLLDLNKETIGTATY